MQYTRKRALLIGLNYPLDASARLNGCCNDVKNMTKYLTTTCGFKSAQIDALTDEDIRNAPKVSRDGLVDALYNLCISSWKEDLELAVFHYSGHGSQARDLNGDEKDGMDEGIVPMDYLVKGLILDEFLLGIFLKFNPKTKIICVFDCCHSGSILDLPYAYDDSKPVDSGVRVVKPLVNVPSIYCISGCRDDQTSADASDDMGQGAGAMTNALLKIIGGKPGVSLLQLQVDLNKSLSTRGFSQRSLLTTSKPIGLGDCLF